MCCWNESTVFKTEAIVNYRKVTDVFSLVSPIISEIQASSAKRMNTYS